jgi:hypothetical protein
MTETSPSPNTGTMNITVGNTLMLIIQSSVDAATSGFTGVVLSIDSGSTTKQETVVSDPFGIVYGTVFIATGSITSATNVVLKVEQY